MNRQISNLMGSLFLCVGRMTRISSVCWVLIVWLSLRLSLKFVYSYKKQDIYIYIIHLVKPEEFCVVSCGFKHVDIE